MWNETTPPRSRALTALALTLCLAATLLQGCAPLVVGGAAVGVSMIHERRSATTIIEDEHIELVGMSLIHNNPEIRDGSRIAVTSYNHVVLLTGQADSDEISGRLADLISRQPKVRRVINEVTVGPRASFARESEDALVTSRVKVELIKIAIPDFDPTRVKVVTEAGTVFLMGLLTPEEAEAVVERARNVPGVEKVVKIFEYIDPSAQAAA